MVVYPDITLEFNGKQYKTKATFKVINEIEQTVSLAQLAMRMSRGDVPLSHLATVFACLLRHAGADVSNDEVYAAMYGGNEDTDQTNVIQTAAIALQAVFPENAAKKKAMAKAKPKPRGRKAAKS